MALPSTLCCVVAPRPLVAPLQCLGRKIDLTEVATLTHNDRARDPAAPTRSERWAAYAANRSSGSIDAAICLAIAVLLAVTAALAHDLFMWGFVALMLVLALQYWERGGVKRLLARRDREIERLRSGE
jgi:hypothetical protein